ncbi:hypothetical protein ACH4D4_04880 [Streptomyces pristinaespiralis]|uniref:hypothetical protein n=1 Tax=Streptomyces pristinaespiralis TaxID=38300 RepID=UPI00378E03BA
MNRLPRPIADWIALWCDLPRHPRQVLLNRAHSWGGSLCIGLLAVMDSFAVHPWTAEVLYAALVISGPSSFVAITGALAHTLWGRGLIWSDLKCQWCGDDPDDGHDDDSDPDDPDDPHGIARDASAWLRTQATCTH